MNAEQLLNLSENIYHLYSHVMDGIVININKSGVRIIQDDFTHEIQVDAINPELKVSDVIEKDQIIGYRILK